MKLSLLCSIGLLMAAPLTAQSEVDSVKIALELLQQSQTQAAAGHLDVAAELAAAAQALLSAQKNGVVVDVRPHLIQGDARLHVLGDGQLHEATEGKELREVIKLENLPDGAHIIIDGEGNVSFGEEGGPLHVIEGDGLHEIFELRMTNEDGCGDENCEGCEECDITCEVECESEESGDFEWSEIEKIETELGALENMRGQFHVMRSNDSRGPHAIQDSGDVQMQLRAVHLELQALRLELQALRMQMGAMRGGMGHSIAPMPMMGGRNARPGQPGMPGMQMLGDFFGGKDGHTMKFGDGGEMDFDFDVEGMLQGLHEGPASGGDVHTEFKVIHNGKTYEGEEARKLMEELGMQGMGGKMRIRMGGSNAPHPPHPPVPAVPAVPGGRSHEIHDHEEL